MKQINPFRVVLADASWDQTEQLEHFALLNLGIVQSLVSGVLSATEAIQRFYHADTIASMFENISETIRPMQS
jgi:hypothetical protein